MDTKTQPTSIGMTRGTAFRCGIYVLERDKVKYFRLIVSLGESASFKSTGLTPAASNSKSISRPR